MRVLWIPQQYETCASVASDGRFIRKPNETSRTQETWAPRHGNLHRKLLCEYISYMRTTSFIFTKCKDGAETFMHILGSCRIGKYRSRIKFISLLK